MDSVAVRNVLALDFIDERSKAKRWCMAQQSQPRVDPHLMFLLGGLVFLMALGDNSLLLLNRCDLSIDNGVQLLTHVVLDIQLIIHYFAGNCLLKFRYF